MKYRAIISEAWHLTQENKKLIWWFAFLPALITTLVGIVYLGYQGYGFWNSPYFRSGATGDHSLQDAALQFGENLIQNHPMLAVLTIVIIAIVALAYLMLPVFTQGALIQLIANHREGKAISVLDGISYGFTRFLQLFEYHLFIKTFSFIGIGTEAVMVLRFLGPEAFSFFGWILLLVLIVGVFLGLLFTYSEYYIVIDEQGVFNSILKSSGMVVRNWHHTLFMLLLMAIISIRILINLIVALLIPILVVLPVFLFTSVTLAKVGLIVGVIVGLIGLYFTSYFIGIFHVFATAVWTYTFLELTSRGKKEPVHQQE